MDLSQFLNHQNGKTGREFSVMSLTENQRFGSFARSDYLQAIKMQELNQLVSLGNRHILNRHRSGHKGRR